MCSKDSIEFIINSISLDDILMKRVIEVGSYNVNGTVGPLIKLLSPSEYIGVDICEGPGVDCICRVEDLIGRFGLNSFDFVISTEMIEHVSDWVSVIKNLKGVCRPGGKIIITTRSKGYRYHGCPNDFWRFEKDDLEKIFLDFEEVRIEDDHLAPGVFISCRKPMKSTEIDISGIELYSMVARKRIPYNRRIEELQTLGLRFRKSRAYKKCSPHTAGFVYFLRRYG